VGSEDEDNRSAEDGEAMELRKNARKIKKLRTNTIRDEADKGVNVPDDFIV
jgi:hypothetical protein